MFKFLVLYFITTVFGERNISGLANLSLSLKEGYSLKVKQQHKQMNYEEIFMVYGGMKKQKKRIYVCVYIHIYIHVYILASL